MHIQTTELGIADTRYAGSKLRRAILETAKEPIHMLDLVEKVSEIRRTSFPAKRIAELVEQMEVHGLVVVTE